MSLRFRLTLAYTVLQALVLAVLGVALHATMLRQLQAEVDERLELRAQQVELAVRPGTRSLTREDLISTKLNLTPARRNAPSPYVQVLDREGQVVATSNSLQDQTLPRIEEGLAAALAGRRTFFTVTDEPEAQNIRILSVPVVADRAVVGVLQVGRSLVSLEETMAELRSQLIILGAGILAAAGLVGWLVAHRGLAPLRFISRQAGTIGATTDFGQRIRYGGPSDEVGILAGTVNQLLARVEGTLQSHRDFVADTSHELRNPLLAIRTNLELIDRVPDARGRAECIQEAREQVERTSRLVDDLLLLARIETGQVVERRPLALDQLVARVVHEALLRPDSPEICLDRVEPTRVVADEGRLAQVLTNLIDNAIKHTPASGRIVLRLEPEDGWACLSVADTGEGIHPEDLPHIFERFYRANRNPMSRDGGTGLGLAIVKHITEAHDGRVTVESELGRGSCFTIRLPRRA